MHSYNWVFAFNSVKGNSHIKDNIPCQDNCNVASFTNYSIAVVSDGAGSCSNSHLGSKIAVTSSLFHFEKLISKTKWNKKSPLPKSHVWHEKAKRTLDLVRQDIENYSINHAIDFKSLSCTVIVVIILKTGILVTHIGDGRAGYCDGKDNWKSLITPFHGELANQTVFITSDIWDEEIISSYISSKVINNNTIKAICLLSDGCEKASFECNIYNEELGMYSDPNLPYAPFFNPNINNLLELRKQGKSQEEINQLWENFLENGTDKLRMEHDDKTMIFGVRLAK